jgi:hypothetical protein
VSLNSDAGVDTGDLSADDVSALFGKTKGFKASEPNVAPPEDTSTDEDTDF